MLMGLITVIHIIVCAFLIIVVLLQSGKSGDISAVKVASGNPQLARAAVDAVKQWKYKPYLLNGEPVEIKTQITVNFKLPN